jgi:hypothetical protein
MDMISAHVGREQSPIAKFADLENRRQDNSGRRTVQEQGGGIHRVFDVIL